MKEFRRCPRCRKKVPSDFGRCGNCCLNFAKFESATCAEAKSAFRMGEKERILYSSHIPSDINKWKMFFICLLGGWFGLHYFSLGKKWRGIFQIVGFCLSFIYTYFAVIRNIRVGFLANFILALGIIWLSSVLIWFSDTISILFNRFKYPVSLPYADNGKKGG